MQRRLIAVSVIALTAVTIGITIWDSASRNRDRFSESSESSVRYAISPGSESMAEPQSPAARYSPPSIGVSAAPGVAFNYRYAFRLPNARIAAVQEEHAQKCEAMGITRCRIVGMRYRLVDEDNVEAMLAFKLDPAAARDFGKLGIASVNKAEGMLVDSEITGIDAGAAISEADRSLGNLRAEETILLRQLASTKPPADRQDLQERIAAIKSRIDSVNAQRTDSKESLATTPMLFTYGSGSLIPGFDGSSPIRDAVATAARATLAIASFVIIVFGTLLPWALLCAAAYWLYRRFRPHFPQQLRDEGEAVEA